MLLLVDMNHGRSWDVGWMELERAFLTILDQTSGIVGMESSKACLAPRLILLPNTELTTYASCSLLTSPCARIMQYSICNPTAVLYSLLCSLRCNLTIE